MSHGSGGSGVGGGTGGCRSAQGACWGRGLIRRLSWARRLHDQDGSFHGWPDGLSPREPIQRSTPVSSPTGHLTSQNEQRRAQSRSCADFYSLESGVTQRHPPPSSVGHADQLRLMSREPTRGAEDQEMRLSGCPLGAWLLL